MKTRLERVVEQKIREVINEHMEENSLREFNEIDSLSMMDLIMDIEDSLDISIPLNDTESVRGMDEFIELVINP
jgi:acyl carrier protein